MKRLVILLAACVAAPLNAQALAPKGQITKVWVAEGQNYGFRVFLSDDGKDPLAGCSYDLAYVNTSHTNYQTIVSTLLSSYAQHRPVLLRAFKEASGFCRIDEVKHDALGQPYCLKTKL